MKKILVLVKDGALMQKIRLALFGRAEIYTDERDLQGVADLAIRSGNGYLTVGEARLPLPMSLSVLLRAVEAECDKEVSRLSLDTEARCAFFGGEIIRLTDVELRLLSVLCRANGEFVSREKILSEVWGGDASGGIVNVYVHYLREKLEKGGVKLIVSSRTEGYKIEGRYLKDADNN